MLLRRLALLAGGGSVPVMINKSPLRRLALLADGDSVPTARESAQLRRLALLANRGDGSMVRESTPLCYLALLAHWDGVPQQRRAQLCVDVPIGHIGQRGKYPHNKGKRAATPLGHPV